CQQESNWPWTF
nr:immunoglobulin light chain junction region [Macaca mulatta]MOW51429.1 immunoglobulin light chain junction region [Macaca mulatta]MOW51432.1 immunoglobulin light chain junction region [Macaca mulatta]MOW51785.1 immunoglobulin light chain junction region [Macaca mulatta]MOW52210.1 immunoglobulin light chain junction region [Macaca mulatta]